MAKNACFFSRVQTTLDAHRVRYSERGFAVAVADMHHVYESEELADEEERRRVSALEIFDDPDEFRLVMQHYCLVVAAKDDTATQRVSPTTVSDDAARPHATDAPTDDEHDEHDEEPSGGGPLEVLSDYQAMLATPCVCRSPRRLPPASPAQR